MEEKTKKQTARETWEFVIIFAALITLFSLGAGIYRMYSVEHWIAVLREERGIRQRQAVRMIEIMKDLQAIEPLIAALEDEDSFVRSSVGGILVKIGEPAVEPLIVALGDEYWRVREDAAELLGEIRDPRAVTPLIVVLRDENTVVRREAAEALEKIGWKPVDNIEKIYFLIAIGERWDELAKMGEPAVEPLIAMLGDENTVVRREAAEALEKIGWKPADDTEKIYFLIAIGERWDELAKMGEPAVEPLIAMLGDEDWRVRRGAATALGEIGKPAVEPLIVALRDEEPLVRWNAAEALGGTGDPRAVEPLIVALRDEDSDVRWNAARALGGIGDPRAVEPLIVALRDEHWGVRGYVALVLGEIGDPRAVKPLIATLRDEDRGVRETARRALWRITGKDFGVDLARWQEWWERETR